jgi:hypothetical protein
MTARRGSITPSAMPSVLTSRRTLLVVALGLITLLVVATAVPAIAVTDWKTRGSAVTAGVADTSVSSSLGWTEASVGRTVNKVDGARIRVRTTDGKAAKVDVEADIYCANGNTKYETRTLTTKADKAWTTITLYSPSDRKRGQCVIDSYVDDFYGSKASGLEIQIQTTTY